MSLREKILIFRGNLLLSLIMDCFALLAMTTTAEKEVLFFIDFSPTALQTKNNDFLFYRFFKIFSFLPFQKVVIWNLLNNKHPFFCRCRHCEQSEAIHYQR